MLGRRFYFLFECYGSGSNASGRFFKCRLRRIQMYRSIKAKPIYVECMLKLHMAVLENAYRPENARTKKPIS
jgi:hypothetical protein